MTTAGGTARSLFAAFLCLALVVWSLMPAVFHAPVIFETIQDHAAMIADHGHAHGLEEELARALHGHGHDAADHDHSQAILVAGRIAQPFAGYWDIRRPERADAGPWPVHRIERPPRV
ncbi:hypothetical protein [Roseivivax sp. CAU 1761]